MSRYLLSNGQENGSSHATFTRTATLGVYDVLRSDGDATIPGCDELVFTPPGARTRL